MPTDLVALPHGGKIVVVVPPGSMAPEAHHLRLRSAAAIRRVLVEGVAGDSSGMQKLRRFVSLQSTSLARDIDVINYIAQAGSMGHSMLVLDVPANDAFFTVQEPPDKLSLAERFTEVLTRVGTKLPEAFRDEFMALLTPENLAMMVGALVLMAGASMATGGVVAGVIIALLIAVGVWFIGSQIIRFAELVADGVSKTVGANSKDDPALDQAAEDFADAIAIIGITAFMILMGRVAGKLAKKTGGKVKARLDAKKTARQVEAKPKAAPKAVEEAAPPKAVTKDIADLETTTIVWRYFGEDIPNNPNNWLHGRRTVKYLSDSELEGYRITFKEGKLYDANGKLFDTSQCKTWDGQNKAIFVVDKNGGMFASTYEMYGEFHHSSLGQGKPVAMSGEMEVNNGILKSINNNSGHYKPGPKLLDQIVRYLEQHHGIDFRSVNVVTKKPKVFTPLNVMKG